MGISVSDVEGPERSLLVVIVWAISEESRENQSPRDEIKKPITKEVVCPNGVSNETLPPKQNDNSNNKRSSESVTTSQYTEITNEVVRVQARTPEPIAQAYLEKVSKSLEVEVPDVAECASLRHERGNDTPRDEIGIDAGGDVVKTEEGRGTEHTELESVPTKEKNEHTELKVNENETNATAENIQTGADVLPHSEQNTSVAAGTDESITRGDLNTPTTEPDTGVTQDQPDSKIIENNAKALVAEVISVATLEEQGHGNNVETGETTASE
ncbi:hypothetical protein LOTGIDRAFT_233777 [Lottia gigantea]|uniref:Uncharacterized protein n=1 Tax=Lottia gigantea TaxID=225164 RepID=V4A695_LOTGI|nr:hypothetical protein LOTGIDRAFT_233777 [Lottia gigantea]ESO90525.1 hypothetical protein LOTGIDRAFT_233777 [Lottia gigantea]